eukprot:365714-Chlamydomonas_euryale.AAC.6
MFGWQHEAHVEVWPTACSCSATRDAYEGMLHLQVGKGGRDDALSFGRLLRGRRRGPMCVWLLSRSTRRGVPTTRPTVPPDATARRRRPPSRALSTHLLRCGPDCVPCELLRLQVGRLCVAAAKSPAAAPANLQPRRVETHSAPPAPPRTPASIAAMPGRTPEGAPRRSLAGGREEDVWNDAVRRGLKQRRTRPREGSRLDPPPASQSSNGRQPVAQRCGPSRTAGHSAPHPRWGVLNNLCAVLPTPRMIGRKGLGAAGGGATRAPQPGRRGRIAGRRGRIRGARRLPAATTAAGTPRTAPPATCGAIGCADARVGRRLARAGNRCLAHRRASHDPPIRRHRRRSHRRRCRRGHRHEAKQALPSPPRASCRPHAPPPAGSRAAAAHVRRPRLSTAHTGAARLRAGTPWTTLLQGWASWVGRPLAEHAPAPRAPRRIIALHGASMLFVTAPPPTRPRNCRRKWRAGDVAARTQLSGVSAFHARHRPHRQLCQRARRRGARAGVRLWGASMAAPTPTTLLRCCGSARPRCCGDAAAPARRSRRFRGESRRRPGRRMLV